MRSQQQQRLGWLLRLPPPLEKQFWQESSVQGVYTLLDVLAVTQALILNWYALRKFGASRQEGSAMLPHELLASAVYFVAALAQVVALAAWPKHYRAHRQRIALVNRLLRLLTLLVTCWLIEPANSLRQMHVYFTAIGNAPVNSQVPGQVYGGPQCDVPGWPNPAAGAAPAQPSATQTTTFLDVAGLWRGLLMVPVTLMMHTNWLVPFWVAAVVQAVTFVVSVHNMLLGPCAVRSLHGPASAHIVAQACQQLNWLVHAAAQLLDWQLPGDPLQLSTASDVVCQDPLAGLLLLQLWVRLMCLVLVPCTLVYCLERSLKVGFLSTRHASPANTATARAAEAQPALSSYVGSQHSSYGSQPEGPGSSSGVPNSFVSPGRARGGVPLPSTASSAQAGGNTRQQQLLQRQMLERALLSVEPASVQKLLFPGGGQGLVRYVVSAGLALSAVLVSWLVCEVLVLALLQYKGLECAADGWLRLRA